MRSHIAFAAWCQYVRLLLALILTSTHRPDNPRRVRVHSDVLARQFHGVAGREATHGVFRSRVVREQREGLEGDDRGGGEQFAWVVLRAGALFDELLGRGRVAVVHAEDVDAEHALEIGGSEVEKGFYLGDAGVGDPVGGWVSSLADSLVVDGRRRGWRTLCLEGRAR